MIKLQPLRIPTGWEMQYNNGFFEIDPSETVPKEDRWYFFKEDMLQLVNVDNNLLLDMGFYPEGDMDKGEYYIRLYEGNCAGELLDELITNERMKAVDFIEDKLDIHGIYNS